MFDDAAAEFLRRHFIGVLASVGPDGLPQACTIFYAVDSNESLVFKSRSGSDHMRSLFSKPLAALAVYRHDSTYKVKAGLQLKGTVERISDPVVMSAAVDLYSSKFDGAREKFAPIDDLVGPHAESTLYRFIPQAFKFTDGWQERTDMDYTAAKDS